jgi:hypothetical protein
MSFAQKDFNRNLVKFIGFAFNNGQGARWAFAYAGAQAVTISVGDNARLAVNKLKGAFRTSRDALAAAVAKFFINPDYFSQDFHGLIPLYDSNVSRAILRPFSVKNDFSII